MKVISVVTGGLWLGADHAEASSPALPQSAPVAGVDAGLMQDLVVANRILVDKGVLDTSGHVSVRHPRDPNRYLMAWRKAPELVTAEDIMEHDLDNNVIDPQRRPPYLERFIHTEIYRSRPDVKAVVHGHTPSLVAFSASSIPLRPLFGGAAFMGQSVPVFAIDERGGVVNSPELGRKLAEALGSANAVLMRNHGAVVVGPTLAAMVTRAINLDTNAQIEARLLAMGDKRVAYVRPAPPAPAPAAPTGAAGAAPEANRDWDAYKSRVMTLMGQRS
jgi:HCOMODA/2-hydroxy-3-carboxy-muconic semialdehyde decarboxylase